MENKTKLDGKEMEKATGGYGNLVLHKKARVWIDDEWHSKPDYDSGCREGSAKVGTVFTIGAKAMDWRHMEWVQDERTGFWVNSSYVEPYNG